MTTAVLDANALVSASLVHIGVPAQILAYARAGGFIIVTSIPIMTEVFRVLTYARIQRKYQVGPLDIAQLRRFLQRRAVVTAITVTVKGVATHPEDDLVLATAASGHADYLVTGDGKLQSLVSHEGTKIVSPREFLGILEANSSRQSQS